MQKTKGWKRKRKLFLKEALDETTLSVLILKCPFASEAGTEFFSKEALNETTLSVQNRPFPRLAFIILKGVT